MNVSFLPINEDSMSVRDVVYRTLLNEAPFSGLAEEWDRVHKLAFSNLPQQSEPPNDWSIADKTVDVEFRARCEAGYVVIHVGKRSCVIKRAVKEKLQILLEQR